MRALFSNRNNLIIAICVLLLLLMILFAQLNFLSPLKTDLAGKQMELDTAQKILTTMNKNKGNETAALIDDTRGLQQRIPVKPLQEQLIVDLQKAETISNSEIKSMGFTKDGSANADSVSNGQTAEQATGQTNTESQTQADTQAAQTAQNNSAAIKGMKKLTVQLKVESPKYEDFEKFINTLESLKRIVVVESINYSDVQEITSVDQGRQPLTYDITVSAYYMPELTDLKAQLPKMDSPEPANKDNPLSQFADTPTP
ncbi:hypothetical protein [Neobacillus muris]|uniref:hypothetical protein n=1 Tax=Neobacillus muris TaxID=2941334 RepID=UPI00204184FC|nr:hypothetical protein [Neobacillus muris]